MLWFRRAPPFSGDTVHPRRHTGGEGFLENLDNQTRATQTGIERDVFVTLFSQVTNLPRDYIWVNPQASPNFMTNSRSNTQVTRFSYYAQQRVI